MEIVIDGGALIELNGHELAIYCYLLFKDCSKKVGDYCMEFLTISTRFSVEEIFYHTNSLVEKGYLKLTWFRTTEDKDFFIQYEILK